jgi:hypothetical protein
VANLHKGIKINPNITKYVNTNTVKSMWFSNCVITAGGNANVKKL